MEVRGEVDVLGDAVLQRRMLVQSVLVLALGLALSLIAAAFGGWTIFRDGWAVLWAVLVTMASLAVHELVHALFFLIMSRGRCHVSFGAAAGFLYTRTDDCMLPKGLFICVLLAPTVLVTAGIVAAGFALSFPAESLIVAAVHLSGCVGDWDMAKAIATTPHVTHVKDSETGCILLG